MTNPREIEIKQLWQHTKTTTYILCPAILYCTGAIEEHRRVPSLHFKSLRLGGLLSKISYSCMYRPGIRISTASHIMCFQRENIITVHRTFKFKRV